MAALGFADDMAKLRKRRRSVLDVVDHMGIRQPAVRLAEVLVGRDGQRLPFDLVPTALVEGA